ncbi:MAG TPA: mechanosensitive ion channel [Saccharofermentans sp.]|nr:mechanosensitive ion channel [Saccharofermentans sp.]HPJ80894.1 mechanosensitive ion channel [Saccharofermentans sp.]HPQ32203.1 mechanosensitive ion channel [Saccharofermentans sp.]HRV51035.1 mechanosensitive ion channel [Saccharofermentans sp.]
MFKLIDWIADNIDKDSMLSNVLIPFLNVLAIAILSLVVLIVLNLVTSLLKKSKSKFISKVSDLAMSNRFPTKFSLFAIVLIISKCANRFPGIADFIVDTCFFLSIIIMMVVISSIIDIANAYYMTKMISKKRPIKGPLQIARIVIFFVLGLIMIAKLINQNPIVLISGIGAFTAILSIVFKDALLGLVASIQLTSDGLLRIGDFISLPKEGIEGTVMDISLMSVRIHAFDNTICTVPAYTILSSTFRNWYEIERNKNRQIKLIVWIDSNSIKALNQAQSKATTKKFPEIELSNIPNAVDPTNLYMLRMYLHETLKNIPGIRKDSPIICSTSAMSKSEGIGIPLEIICYTSNIEYNAFCQTTSLIYEMVISKAKDFDLVIYQK